MAAEVRVGRMVTTTLLAMMAVAPLGAQQRQGVDVRLTGRAHIQFSTSSVDEDDAGSEVVASTFEQRRLRVGAIFRVAEWVEAKVEPELSGARLRLADAWVALELDPAAVLTVGQLKRPFSLLELSSSTTLPAIERGVRIRGLSDLIGVELPAGASSAGEQYEILSRAGYVGRDIGAALSGSMGAIGYSVGLFNGSGPDRPDVNDAKTLAGRVTLRPSATLPLAFGAAAISLDRERGPAAERAVAFEADLEYGRFGVPGPRLLAEASFGDGVAAGDRMVGVQGMIGWFHRLAAPRLEALELTGRASWGDPRRAVDADEGLLLTPGLNLYIRGRNRLMVNWDVYLPAAPALDPVHALRAQVGVQF